MKKILVILIYLSFATNALAHTITADYSLGTVGGSEIGDSGANTKQAQSFTTNNAGTLECIRFRTGSTSGSPTDSVITEIQSDSSGSPSGSVLATYTFTNGLWLPTSERMGCYRISVTGNTKYWVVIYRSGANNGSNFRRISAGSGSTYAGGDHKKWNGSAWSAVVGDDLSFDVTINETSSSYTDSSIRALFSVSSASNMLTYNNSTGVFTTDNTTYWNGAINQTSIATTTIRHMFEADSPIGYVESTGTFFLDYDSLIIDSENIGDISDYVYGLFTGTDPIVYDGEGDFSCPTCGEGGGGVIINSNPYNAHLETYQTLLFTLLGSFLLVLFIKLIRSITNRRGRR